MQLNGVFRIWGGEWECSSHVWLLGMLGP